jgi:hypothetical protein
VFGTSCKACDYLLHASKIQWKFQMVLKIISSLFYVDNWEFIANEFLLTKWLLYFTTQQQICIKLKSKINEKLFFVVFEENKLSHFNLNLLKEFGQQMWNFQVLDLCQT